MDLPEELDTKTRTINKFYDKIRSHLEDVVVREPERAKPVTELLSNIGEEDKYGVIRKEEFDALIRAHEKQPNKPIKCGALTADYLIEDLRINDINRNTFLGGHSNYTVSEENSLPHLRRNQLVKYITHKSKEFLEEMDKGRANQYDVQIMKIQIDKLYKLDSKHGDNQAVMGRYLLIIRDFHRAIDELRSALNNKTNHEDLVKKNLALALYEEGFRTFQHQEYEDAFKLFEESLLHDPSHQGARHHLEQCNNFMLQNVKRPFGYQDPYSAFSQRRK